MMFLPALPLRLQHCNVAIIPTPLFAGYRRRPSVYALAPCESALHLKAMTHAFGHLRFQSVIVGPSLVKHSANRTVVRIDPTRAWIPQITGGGQSRKSHIGVIHTERL